MKRIFIYALPIMMALSCSRSTNDDSIIDGVETTYKTLTISATKSTGDNITDGYESFSDGDAMRMGLFSYSSDSSCLEPYSDALTADIYVKYNSSDDTHESDYWTYGYGREGTAANVAYKEIADKIPVLAAYYPYRDAADLKHIPFNLADKQGLMWCKPVDITDGNRDNVSLEFHHSMAKVKINVKFAQSGYYPVLPRIFGLKACEGTEFIESANYDATSGVFSDAQEVSGILALNTYSINPNKYDVYTLADYDSKYEIEIYLVPGLEFAGLDICLAWEGTSIANYEYLDGLTIGTDEIQIEALKGDETTFMAGYEYTYTITVDNYLKFAGITIDTDWIDSDTPFTGNI